MPMLDRFSLIQKADDGRGPVDFTGFADLSLCAGDDAVDLMGFAGLFNGLGNMRVAVLCEHDETNFVLPHLFHRLVQSDDFG